jgi:hypothetical protein
VGGFQGGHGKVELLFGAVRVLCRNTPLVQCSCSAYSVGKGFTTNVNT